MKGVRVKICGITNWADAKSAMDAGADALGFNFYERSPRKIPVSHAREIIRHMPRDVAAVGVFVNAPKNQILKIAKLASLSMLQLHGDESQQVVESLSKQLPLIKAFRVKEEFSPARLKSYSSAAAFLLDGHEDGKFGGTGKAFDWATAIEAKKFGPVILAGGLRPENVAEAIRQVKPFAVDVCSGVEASPGEKNLKKLRALMREVEKAARALGRN